MKVLGKLLAVLFVCVFLAHVSALAADKRDLSTAPKTNNGKKWHIGYYEGGEYIAYPQFLTETVKGLMELGWIEIAEIPAQKGEQTKDLWNWLVTKAKSKYIQFVKDAHYTANWDENLRKTIAAEIINRLNQKKDIDLMIAMGTWAGQDLANNKHCTPAIVLSASDALGAGIIKSNEDSGYDHVHARVDPSRYERQVRVFHDIIEFQKLGVAYENTAAGKSYAAIDKVEKVARERGFEIVRCYTKSDIADVRIAEESVKKCFRELAENVGAIYVTVQGGVSLRSIPELVKIANSCGIPTFSQTGSEEVKYGFLFSLSQAGYKYVGRFNAETFAKVFNGAKPREVDQIFEAPRKIAINLETAVNIGFDPPVDILGAADEIYREIMIPEQ